MRFLLATYLIINTAFALAGVDSPSKTSKKYTFDQDVKILIESMENHQVALSPKFRDRKFAREWDKVKPRLTALAAKEFASSSEFVQEMNMEFARLKSSHDGIYLDNVTNASKLSFPFGFKFFAKNDDSKRTCELVLIERSGFKLPKSLAEINRSKVLKISSIPACDVVSELAKKESSEVEWKRKVDAAQWALPRELESMAKDGAIELTIAQQGKQKIVVVPLLQRDQQDSMQKMKIDFYFKEMESPKEGKIIYVRIPQMIDHNVYVAWKDYVGMDVEGIPVMSDFAKDIVEAVKKSGAKRVVIDVRGNDGGWSSVGKPIAKLFKNGEVKFLSTTYRRSKAYWERINRVGKGGINALSSQISLLEKSNGNQLEIKELRKELADEEKEFKEAITRLQNPLPLNEELSTSVRTWDLGVAEPELANIPADLLIDEGSLSATEIFAMAWKTAKMGRIVGSPTGNGCNIFTENAVIELPQSKAKLRLSLGFQDWANQELAHAGPRGVEPDVLVHQTADDFIRNEDSVAKEVYGLSRFP